MPQPDFTPNDFRLFTDFIHQRSGLYFDDNKFSVVRTVIKERVKATGSESIAAYYEFLTGVNMETAARAYETGKLPNPARSTTNSPERELNRLLELLTVNETAFFRNKDHYRAIKEEVLPRLLKRNRSTRQIRIWSAGCSTGQEPYSLAIAVLQCLEQAGLGTTGPFGWKIEIVASDISERALKIAQAGRYRRDEMRGLEESQISRYFLSLSSPSVTTAPLDPDQLIAPGRPPLARYHDRIAYEVAPNVRSLIKFNNFNLATPIYPVDRLGHFDLVLCENVTIYFPPAITQQVIKNLYNVMLDGAFLFIGYSETLWQVSDSFKLINSHDTFYYQKPFPGEPMGGYLRSRPLTGPLDVYDQPEIPSPTRGTTDKLIPRPIPTSQRTPPSFKAVNSDVGTGKLRNDLTPPPRTRVSEPLKPPPPPPPPTPWKEALEQGLALMKEHDFDNAAIYLERALQVGAKEPKVLVAMARLKTTLGDYKAAFDYSRRAVQADSLCEEAHLILAMIHHKEGRIEASIAEFQNTIYINFESVIAHMRLADIYRSMGQNANAVKEYRSALGALSRYRPDDMIEDLPVELLKKTCEENIRRFSKR